MVFEKKTFRGLTTKTYLTGFLQRINIIALCSQRSIWLVYSIANQNPSFFSETMYKTWIPGLLFVWKFIRYLITYNWK